MKIDRVDAIAEHALLASAPKDPVEPRDHAGVKLAQVRIPLQVPARVNVLDTDEADEIGIAFVVIEGGFDQATQRLARAALVYIEAIFEAPDAAIGLGQYRQIELLLAAEVVIDHPL